MESVKRILILSIAICLLFSVASVCASEVNDTTMNAMDTQYDLEISEDNHVIEKTSTLIAADNVNASLNEVYEEGLEISAPDSDELKSNDDLLESAHTGEGIQNSMDIAGEDVLSSSEAGDGKDVLGENPAGNYRSLKNLIDGAKAGDIITLDRNYVFTDALNYWQKMGIEINKNGLTIDGQGYTIDALGKSRIFNINTVDIKFINITFKNAYSNSDGGAIYLNNCLKLAFVSVSVVNCSFVNNSAAADGSAIYLKNNALSNSISVVNCSFVNNSAIAGTGTVCLKNNAFYNSVCVVNCSFVNNSACNDDGAVCLKSNGIYNSIRVEDCSFVNNSACNDDGAVCLKNNAFYNSVCVEDCSFVNNSACNDDGAVCLKNNAFYNSVCVEDCSFVNNSAGNNSGALCLRNNAFCNSVGVVNCIFADNYAGNNGSDVCLKNNAFYNSVRVIDVPTQKHVKTNLSIAVSDITYGEYPVVNLTADVSGNYSIVVAGKNYGGYELNENNGHHVSITVPVLLNVADGYQASVEFNGTGNYAPAVNRTTFNVNQALPDFDVMPGQNEYVYGQDVVCSIDLQDDGTGSVTFCSLNEIIGKIDDVSQQKSLNLGKFNVGQYLVLVNYSGDNNYRNSTKKIVFNVTPADNAVKVNVASVSYPDEVTVSVSATVDGVYAVEINGTVYDVTANGSGVNLKLAAGTYYANVTNSSMANYNIISTNATFTVNKAVNNIIVTVGEVVFPNNANVVVKADADGVYTVLINGTSVVVNVIDGVGNASVALPVGKSYMTNVAFTDFENYTFNISNAVFDVAKGINRINVTANDVNYPDNVIIMVNADYGEKFTVNINGTDYYNVSVRNGLSIRLPVGIYCARVVGYSSEYYEGVITNATFTVKKGLNNVVVSIENVDTSISYIGQGNNPTSGDAAVYFGKVLLPGNVTVVVKADADGEYTVSINGTSVVVNVVGGVGNASIHLPANKSYETNVKFTDIENYTLNITNAIFDVAKRINKVNLTVEYNESSHLMDIKVDADFNDTFTLVIDGSADQQSLQLSNFESRSVMINDGTYTVAIVDWNRDDYELSYNPAEVTVG